MFNYKILFTVFVLISSLNSCAQTSNVDHLVKECKALIMKGEDSTEICLDAVMQAKDKYGKSHNATLVAKIGLADSYGAKGEYEKAESLIIEVTSIFEQKYPEKLNGISANLELLSNIYVAQQKYKQAEAPLLQALSINQSLYGKDSFEVARTLADLGYIHNQLDLDILAERELQEAMNILQNRKDEDSQLVLSDATLSLSELYIKTDKLTEAETLARQAYDIDSKIIGKDNEGFARDFMVLAKLYRAQGKYEEAKQRANEAVDLLIKRLGKEHPKTKQYIEKRETMGLLE